MNRCGFRVADCRVGEERIRRPDRPVRNMSGFTFLEVMVAVSIMGMVLVSLLGLKNRSVEDVMLVQHMTTATMLAKRMMADTIISRPTLTENEGPFPEEEYKDYTWKKTVAPTPFTNIVEVRVAVLWNEGTRQESVELVDYE